MDINVIFNIQVQASSAECRDMQTPSFAVSLKETLWQQYRKIAACRSDSTMNNYATAIRALCAYLESDIALQDLTAAELGGFERWLQHRGLCLNTISCYMRSLRSLLMAIDEGHVRKCFSTVYTGNARTEKRSVSTDAIARLKALALPVGSFSELARDVFLFSFYAMGMPFVDVAHLRRTQVEKGRFCYNRQKTGQRVTVVVEPAMAEIISRHATSETANDYVFPLLTTGSHREYCTALGRYNRTLHRLAVMADIRENLTSYVVRHTWASMAYGANVDLPVISKALGHTNPQTTLTYIREIDDQRLAKANHEIISKICYET